MKNMLYITVILLIIMNIILISYFKKKPDLTVDTYNDNNQPSIRLNVHYTTYDGIKKEMTLYDNSIDVGNEIINSELRRVISDYRDTYMVCTCNPPEIKITEDSDRIIIIIDWHTELRIYYIGG